MSVDLRPLQNQEHLSDAELLAVRAKHRQEPHHREWNDAELLRRQMARQTRATRFAAIAAVAAAISALANLLLVAARLLGWIP